MKIYILTKSLLRKFKIFFSFIIFGVGVIQGNLINEDEEAFIYSCYEALDLSIFNEKGVEEKISLSCARLARTGEIELVYKIVYRLTALKSIIKDQDLSASETKLKYIYRREIIGLIYELLSNEILRSEYLIKWQKILDFDTAQTNLMLLNSVREDWISFQNDIFEQYADEEKFKNKRQEQISLRDIFGSDFFEKKEIKQKTWKLFATPLKSWLRLLTVELLKPDEITSQQVLEDIISKLSKWIYIHDYLCKLNQIRNFIETGLEQVKHSNRDLSLVLVEIRDFVLTHVKGKFFDIPLKQVGDDYKIINKGENVWTWDIVNSKMRYGHSQLLWLEFTGYLGYIKPDAALYSVLNTFAKNLTQFIEDQKKGLHRSLKIEDVWCSCGEKHRKNAQDYLIKKNKDKALIRLETIKLHPSISIHFSITKQRAALAALVALGEYAKLLKKFKGQTLLDEFGKIRDIVVLHFEENQMLENLYRFHLLQNKLSSYQWNLVGNYLNKLDLEKLEKLSSEINSILDWTVWKLIIAEIDDDLDESKLNTVLEKNKIDPENWNTLKECIKFKCELHSIGKIFLGPSLHTVHSAELDNLLKQDPLLKIIYSNKIEHLVESIISWREKLFSTIITKLPDSIKQNVYDTLLTKIFVESEDTLANITILLNEFIISEDIADKIQSVVSKFYEKVDPNKILKREIYSSLRKEFKLKNLNTENLSALKNKLKDTDPCIETLIGDVTNWRTEFDKILEDLGGNDGQKLNKKQIGLIRQRVLAKIFSNEASVKIDKIKNEFEKFKLNDEQVEALSEIMNSFFGEIDIEKEFLNKKFKRHLNFLKQHAWVKEGDDKNLYWQNNVWENKSKSFLKKLYGTEASKEIISKIIKAFNWRTGLENYIKSLNSYNAEEKLRLLNIILGLVFVEEKSEILNCKEILRNISLDTLIQQEIQISVNELLNNIKVKDFLNNPDLIDIKNELANNKNSDGVRQSVRTYKNRLSNQLVSPKHNLIKKLKLVQFWCKYLASLINSIEQILLDNADSESPPSFCYHDVLQLLKKNPDKQFALEYAVNVLRAVLDVVREHMAVILCQVDESQVTEDMQGLINFYHLLMRDIDIRIQSANAYFHNHDLRSSNYIKEAEMRVFSINAMHSLMNELSQHRPKLMEDYLPKEIMEESMHMLNNVDSRLKKEFDTISEIPPSNVSPLASLFISGLSILTGNNTFSNQSLLDDSIPPEIKKLWREMLLTIKEASKIPYNNEPANPAEIVNMFTKNIQEIASKSSPLTEHFLKSANFAANNVGDKLSQPGILENFFSQIFNDALNIINLTGQQSEMDPNELKLVELALSISGLFLSLSDVTIMPINLSFSIVSLSNYFRYLEIIISSFEDQKPAQDEIKEIDPVIIKQIVEKYSWEAIQAIITGAVYIEDEKKLPEQLKIFINKRNEFLKLLPVVWDTLALGFQSLKVDRQFNPFADQHYIKCMVEAADLNANLNNIYDELKDESFSIIKEIIESEFINWIPWILESDERLKAYAEIDDINARFYRKEKEILTSTFYTNPGYMLIAEHHHDPREVHMGSNYLIKNEGFFQVLEKWNHNYFQPGVTTGKRWKNVPFYNSVGTLEEYYIDGRTLECGFFGLGITRKRAGELLLLDEHITNPQIIEVMVQEFLAEPALGSDPINYPAGLHQRLILENAPDWTGEQNIVHWLENEAVYRAIVKYLFFDNAQTQLAFNPRFNDGMLEAFSIILNTRIVVWGIQNEASWGIILDTDHYLTEPINTIHLHFLEGHFNLLVFTEDDQILAPTSTPTPSKTIETEKNKSDYFQGTSTGALLHFEHAQFSPSASPQPSVTPTQPLRVRLVCQPHTNTNQTNTQENNEDNCLYIWPGPTQDHLDQAQNPDEDDDETFPGTILATS